LLTTEVPIKPGNWRKFFKNYAGNPINHTVNQGLGNTIRDGLIEVANLSGNDDIIITMDADDTHTPGLILKMIRMIKEGHDVVIASRYQPNSRVVGLVWYRKVLSYFASLIFRIFMPIRGVKILHAVSGLIKHRFLKKPSPCLAIVLSTRKDFR
jgi:glycosyltransferase involved in cell wall biosynthesis